MYPFAVTSVTGLSYFTCPIHFIEDWSHISPLDTGRASVALSQHTTRNRSRLNWIRPTRSMVWPSSFYFAFERLARQQLGQDIGSRT